MELSQVVIEMRVTLVQQVLLVRAAFADSVRVAVTLIISRFYR